MAAAAGNPRREATGEADGLWTKHQVLGLQPGCGVGESRNDCHGTKGFRGADGGRRHWGLSYRIDEGRRADLSLSQKQRNWAWKAPVLVSSLGIPFCLLVCLFFKIDFTCMRVFLACSMCVTYMQYLQRPEEDVSSPRMKLQMVVSHSVGAGN